MPIWQFLKSFVESPPPNQLIKVQSDEHDWRGVERQNHPLVVSSVDLDTRKHSSDLSWFFQRKLAFNGCSLRDVSAFLATCKGVTDLDQFGQREWWIHPADFEKSKKGDCEDHALFAWRVLHEMGRDVRLMLGRARKSGHAWVQLYEEECSFILETTAKQDTYPELESGYTPEHSFQRTADGRFIMYSHKPHVIEAAKCPKPEPTTQKMFPSLDFAPEPLSQPRHWIKIDRLIFMGKKNEAHRAIRLAMNGHGSHTRMFLDRYFHLREHQPESFELNDEAYWADWVS